MDKYGDPEKVYVELEWYDGPVSGIADINGAPHRFKCVFDQANDEYQKYAFVSPINTNELELEIEQWCIFVKWNNEYEKGNKSTDSHPGIGGIDSRWDEIETILKESRANVSSSTKILSFKLHRTNRERRYEKSGPDYKLCWRTYIQS